MKMSTMTIKRIKRQKRPENCAWNFSPETWIQTAKDDTIFKGCLLFISSDAATDVETGNTYTDKEFPKLMIAKGWVEVDVKITTTPSRK